MNDCAVACNPDCSPGFSRVDWRFLLPSPDLGKVALCGTGCIGLRDQLRGVSSSLVEVEPAKLCDGLAGGTFDMAVLVTPSTPDIMAATALVKPGGHIYVECFGLARLLQLRSRVAFQHCCSGLWRGPRTLEGCGFKHIRCYWHVPSFERCLRIIPLDDCEVLSFSFTKHNGATLANALIASALRVAGKAEWLRCVVPCFSMIGEKRSSGRA